MWFAGVLQAEVEIPLAPLDAPIVVQAEESTHWQEGQYEVWLLRGRCQVRQDEIVADARDAVIWVDQGNPLEGVPTKIIAYLETDVTISFGQGDTGDRNWEVFDRHWLGRFHTMREVRLPQATSSPPASLPPVVRRGFEARNTEHDQQVRPAQFTSPSPFSLPPGSPPPTAQLMTITPRGGVRSDIGTIPGPNPNETITAATGLRITISGIENVPGLLAGTLTIEADRVIAWTDSASFLFGRQQVSGRWEFYLEGNIVFREGSRVIYADRMYYDLMARRGTILNAEALTPVPEYEGLMRLKADVLHQLDAQNLLAYGAAITSSRLGVPRYWIQAGNVSLRDEQVPLIDPFTGQQALNPGTNEPAVDHKLQATSRSNFVYVGGVPVLYWPVLATNLRKPTFYVDRVKFANDSVFGTQALIDWDLYQLLGLNNELIPGSKWTLSTDWLSERGFGLGTNFSYAGDGLFRVPGPVSGQLDAWGIKDNGLDNLGLDRRALAPEEDFRGRIRWQHRQQLAGGFQFTGELGVISDRNFLEQYFETEWDQFKDQTTNLELKRYVANSSWSVLGRARINDFFTQTEWLPRFDHYLIGQSFLHDRLTWHGHSHVGYGKLRTATPPTLQTPLEAKFDPLAWEAEREGIHTATRHEINMPLNVGPAKVVPYVLGELFHVGEDLAGVDRTRAYGQAGARTSLALWRADRGVQSQLFNLNGLAHKVSVESEFLWADANEDLDRFPLYEELDDDSIEFFRRRFFFDTFGGMPGGNVPLQFDERNFAFRSNMQSRVTAPVTAIADDLMLFKMGLRQRWQTKRGPPGYERIIDWIVLDVEGSFFPRAARDNFGEDFGVVNYDFRWHVGDRLTMLSDGYADFFGDGLRTFTLGSVITRPERGQVYFGFRTIEGPISSNILTGSVGYRMSEKWILTGGTSVDLGATGNIGQYLGLTRVGESALIRIGFNADRSRNNVGINFSIEPRFLASNRLGLVGGVQIPPAGAYGLE